MTFTRDLWTQLGRGAEQGRTAWSRSRRGDGWERVLWIAATVLMAIPIFALLVVALLGALSLTVAALVAAWLWEALGRLGLVRRRDSDGRENVRIRDPS